MKTPRKYTLSFSWGEGLGQIWSISFDSNAVLVAVAVVFGVTGYILGKNLGQEPRGVLLANTVSMPREVQYEPIAQSKDIITPLNVRDASALVMGPGASDPPEAAPPPPPSVPSSAVRRLTEDDPPR